MIPHISTPTRVSGTRVSFQVTNGERDPAGAGYGDGDGEGGAAGFFWIVMVTVTWATELLVLAGTVFTRTALVMVAVAPSTAIAGSVMLSSLERSSAEPEMSMKSGAMVTAVMR